MIAGGFLWIPFTLLAAAGQTARNAMQRELTAKLGTVGATHVRFLFGFPFALVFLAGVLIATGLPTAHAAVGVLALGCCRRRRANPRHRADARDHERPLVRGHHRLHQDRGDPGGDFRPDLPGRSADHRHGRRHPRRDGGRRHHVAQGQGRDGRRLPSGRAGAVLRCGVRDFGGWLSRRDPRRSGCRVFCWRRRSRWRSG